MVLERAVSTCISLAAIHVLSVCSRTEKAKDDLETCQTVINRLWLHITGPYTHATCTTCHDHAS